MMNLYLVTRTDQIDYNQYSAAVVAASSDQEARSLWPGPQEWISYPLKSDGQSVDLSKPIELTISSLEVKLICYDCDYNKPVIVLSDYNAS